MSYPGYPPPPQNQQNYYAQPPPTQQPYPHHTNAPSYPYAPDQTYSYSQQPQQGGPNASYPVTTSPYLYNNIDPAYPNPSQNTGVYNPPPATAYPYPAPYNDGRLPQPSTLPAGHSSHSPFEPSVSPVASTSNYQQPHQPLYQVSSANTQEIYPAITPGNPTIAKSASPNPLTTTSAPAPRALKIKFKKPVEPESAPPTSMPTRRASAASYSAENYSATSGRHMRSTRAVKASYTEQGSDESEEDFKPRAGGRSKSGRNLKAPSRYAGGDEEDGDAFEDSMMTSPAVATNASARSTRGGRLRKRVVDPSDEEEDAQGEVDGDFNGSPVAERLSYPSRPTRSSLAQAQLVPVENDGQLESQEIVVESRRPTRGSARAKSRNSSADAESWHGSEEESATAGEEDDDSEDDFGQPRRPARGGGRPRKASFVVEDDDEDFSVSPPKRSKKQPRRSTGRSSGRVTRNSTRAQDESEDDQPRKRSLRERATVVNYALPPADITAEMAASAENVREAIAAASGPKRGGLGRQGGSLTLKGVGMGFKLPGDGMLERPQAMGDPDSSDSELDAAGPMRAGAGGGGGGMVAAGGAGQSAGKIQGPSDVPNFGRINPKSSTADADPLGVDMNVTFDNVGGLDGHINQLKEMVALPLLYPELFQQFGVTPPRGVLFHGPPGTGKTLLARALAASCSNGNTKISFFMRKGADVLSKWVGEAERQLRMLFEEARAAQPSIIFFDEIDGLAPVRSSKQDQIHASLVSTLLALMDGMDGRGQVIVIGATNRPDSVDPALRRPGRFDREFYFPLPNKEARKKIIGINTRKWSPGLSDERLDHLAGLTKGYGGADLRALCTEAALNAIQRRYPQIYTSTDRLLLDPGSITVGAKDFMMSVKKIIPSSARSTASAASQLPSHLVPLLAAPLERVKAAVDKALPRHKQKSALEEAQYEDEIGDDLQKHMMVQSLDSMRTYRPRVLIHGPHGMGQGYIGPALLHHLEGFHVQTLDLGTIVGDSTRTPEATLVQLFVEAKRHQPAVLYIPSLTAFVAGVTDTARTTFKSLLDSVPSADQVLLLAIMDGLPADLPRDVRKWFGVGKEGKVELVKPDLTERETYFADLVESFQKPPTSFPDALPRRKRQLEELPLAPPLPPREPTAAEIERELARDKSAQNMMQHSFVSYFPDLMRKYSKPAKDVKEIAMEEYERLVANAEAAKQVEAAETVEVEANGEPMGDILPGLGFGSAAGQAQDGHTGESLPNGSGALVLQVNGLQAYPSDSAMLGSASASGQTVDMPASQPLPVVDDLTSRNTSRNASLEPSANPSSTNPAHPLPADANADATDPIAALWKPHNIDMEQVYRKFFTQKYYTPQMLMDDIYLIKANADRVGTPAQVSAITAMVTSLNCYIDEFDKRWDGEFQRLKERMEGRERERKERKEERRRGRAAAAAAAALDSTDATRGEGGSGAEGGVGGVSGIGEKRARESGDGANSDGGAAKRQRSDAMDIDTDGPASSHLSTTDLPRPTPAQVIAQAPSNAIPSVPPPSYPPFICPSNDLSALSAALRHSSGSFSIDQLEQLRAGVYDLLWRRRGDWDRTNVLREAKEWVGGFERDVREWEEEEGEE